MRPHAGQAGGGGPRGTWRTDCTKEIANVRQVVTFDAYGTLIDFRLSEAVRQVLADRLPMDGVDGEEFLDDFRVMRFQAVLEPCGAVSGSTGTGGRAVPCTGLTTSCPICRPCRPCSARCARHEAGPGTGLPRQLVSR